MGTIKTQIIVDPTVDRKSSSFVIAMGLSDSLVDISSSALVESMSQIVENTLESGELDKIDIALMLEQFDQDVLNYFLVNVINDLISQQVKNILSKRALQKMLKLLKDDDITEE